MRLPVSPQRRQGFSLIEVVLAVGIIGSILVIVLALFGSLMTQARDTLDRQTAIRLTSALEGYLGQELQKTNGFQAVYDWFQGGAKRELFALEYRANLGDGAARDLSSGGNIGTDFLISSKVGEKAPVGPFLNARQEKIYGMVLSLSKANPLQTLPAAASYERAHLALNVKVYALSSPTAVIPPTASPILTYDLALLR